MGKVRTTDNTTAVGGDEDLQSLDQKIKEGEVAYVPAYVDKLFQKQKEGIEEELKNQKADLKELRKETSDIKQKSIEMLGIFVAVFTFISIDFQILKTVTNTVSGLGLILVSAGLLLLFPLAVSYILDPKNKSFKKLQPLPKLVIWLVSLGMVTIILGSFRFVDDKFTIKGNDLIFTVTLEHKPQAEQEKLDIEANVNLNN